MGRLARLVLGAKNSLVLDSARERGDAQLPIRRGAWNEPRREGGVFDSRSGANASSQRGRTRDEHDGERVSRLDAMPARLLVLGLRVVQHSRSRGILPEPSLSERVWWVYVS